MHPVLESWAHAVVQAIGIEGAIHGLSSAQLNPHVQAVVMDLLVLSQAVVFLNVVATALNFALTRRMDDAALARFVVEQPILAYAPAFAQYTAYGLMHLAATIAHWHAVIVALGIVLLLAVGFGMKVILPVIYEQVLRAIEAQRVIRQQRAQEQENRGRGEDGRARAADAERAGA